MFNVLNYTFSKPSCITHIIRGNFTGSDDHIHMNDDHTNDNGNYNELVVTKSNMISIIQISHDGRHILPICEQEFFGHIRSICVIHGVIKDDVCIGCDSGQICILRYDKGGNELIRIEESRKFGGFGCLKDVPGEFLAVDVFGRIVLTGAIMNKKFFFLIKREENNKGFVGGKDIKLSPKIEHIGNNGEVDELGEEKEREKEKEIITFDIVSLEDKEKENPKFVCIELDCKQKKKNIVLYEMGIQQKEIFTEKREIDLSAHIIIPLPLNLLNGWFFVCCEDNITLYDLQLNEIVKKRIPRREEMVDERKLMIINYSSNFNVDDGTILLLIQSELGDLYRVTFDINDNGEGIDNFYVDYYDTIEVANAMCILDSGCLFVAAEFSDHKVYYLTNEEEMQSMIISGSNDENNPIFKPHKTRNINVTEVGKLRSLAPILDMKVCNVFDDGVPQIVCLCGRGPYSSIRVLKHGLEVENLGVHDLTMYNSEIKGIFTIDDDSDDAYTKGVVISFKNSSLILDVDGAQIVQANQTKLFSNASTINVKTVKEGGVCQIHAFGVINVNNDTGSITKAITTKEITHGQINDERVVVACGGELKCYEFLAGDLVNIEIGKIDLTSEISCLAISQISIDDTFAPILLAVGSYDKQIQIMNLNTNQMFSVLARTTLSEIPVSIEFIEMKKNNPPVDDDSDETDLFLYVGLISGVLLIIKFDKKTGQFNEKDTVTRLLGDKAVYLSRVNVDNQDAILATSNRSLVCYNHQSKFQIVPISYAPLKFAASFKTRINPGIVGIDEKSFHVIKFLNLGEVMSNYDIPLQLTPRKFVFDDETKNVYVIETDHNLRVVKRQNNQRTLLKTKPKSGCWISQITAYNIKKKVKVNHFCFDDNEATFCLELIKIDKGKKALVVGTGKDVVLYPKLSCKGGFINVFLIEQGSRLRFKYKKEVNDLPYSVHSFHTQLLIGVGSSLRLYEMNSVNFGCKCENNNFPKLITCIKSEGFRIFVSDISNSIYYVKYKKSMNILMVFANSTIPKWVTTMTPIDYHTVCGADKLGNIFFSRLDKDVEEDVDKFFFKKQQKAKEISNFYVGETITGISKMFFSKNNSGVIIYSTITGGIGMLIPFYSKFEYNFFSLLESLLRDKRKILSGNKHLKYRSAYYPVQSVIDGDLCNEFDLLGKAQQNEISLKMKISVTEIKERIMNKMDFVQL